MQFSCIATYVCFCGFLWGILYCNPPPNHLCILCRSITLVAAVMKLLCQDCYDNCVVCIKGNHIQWLLDVTAQMYLVSCVLCMYAYIMYVCVGGNPSETNTLGMNASVLSIG